MIRDSLKFLSDIFYNLLSDILKIYLLLVRMLHLHSKGMDSL